MDWVLVGDGLWHRSGDGLGYGLGYRKSALFRHSLAVFSLYRELCDLHMVDCAWIRTL